MLAFFSWRMISMTLFHEFLVLVGDIVVVAVCRRRLRACRAMAGFEGGFHLPAGEFDEPMDLFIRNEHTLCPGQARSPRRQIKHVALADESFRAFFVEDDAAVEAAGDLEGDARGHVGLDDAR